MINLTTITGIMPRSARRQASRKWMFCALSTMYLRERLVETESALCYRRLPRELL
jgi:hypothetical protein